MPLDSAFSIDVEGDVLTVNFDVARLQKNTDNVRYLHQALAKLKQTTLTGGPILKIWGRHSYPMSFVLAHALSHLYGAIAVYDTTLEQYIVAISHDPDYPLGSLVA